MITAFGREEVMRDANGAGVDAFLIKPVTRSTLFDTIMQAFGHKGGTRRGRRTARAHADVDLTPVRGAQVLLVEDNEINQDVARELLEKPGLVVTVASNGKEAVQAVEQRDFDIVLMDVQMPEMDGLEATRVIRKLGKPGISDLPIVAMTAHAMAGDREKSLDAGMNDHLTKPIDPSELFRTLLEWIKPGERATVPVPAPDEPETPAPAEPPSAEKPLRDVPGIPVQKGRS